MEHDHMIEAFATNGSDHPLDIGSLPRRARCRQDFANAQVSHVFSEVIAKDRIAVAQEVARELGKGKCLAQLLSGPICANECRWRPLGILYGHGDTERASFRRRRAGYALQQQRGGQRSFERDRSGGKHQRNLHSEDVYSSDINFRDDLGVV